MEFLVKKEIPTSDIHVRFQRAYADDCICASIVKTMGKAFKDGNTDFDDQPCSGRPRKASTDRNKEKLDELITENRRVTVGEMAAEIGIGQRAVHGGNFVPTGFPPTAGEYTLQ
jgi:transposase